MSYTRAQIDELFKTLPSDVNEAISSVDTMDIIIGIEKKHKLHIDQTGELSNEVLLLTLGLTSPQKFIGNLENRMKISRENAKEIATEVNEKIFRPVRESLMQIHKMKESSETQEDTSIESASTVPQNEIPEQYDIKNNKKNETEETQPVRSVPPEIKNIAENKLTEPFTLPKKPIAPDPYRESV